MQYFNHLDFKGFRRLADFQLELRPLCVLIGANASGKTSVLDAFSLLARSAAGRLKKTLSEMGGIGANLTGGDAPGRGMGDGPHGSALMKISPIKTRDADRILRGQNLLVAANACAELKAFLNTILEKPYTTRRLCTPLRDR